ncbi:MAG: flagellar basal body P-ring protein FlgI [Phycisphaeraceae bacterium]
MRYKPVGSAALTAVLLGVGLTLAGCSGTAKPPPTPPRPTYSGPRFLHGTVGSLTQLRGYQPLLVSGYGLVVNLHGTGSSEVPIFLRQWLINEMRKQGVGQVEFAEMTGGQGPARILNNLDTAVVEVKGLIPPGAMKDTRFDLVVSALDQTQTTSLEGGQLWTTPLAVNGANPQLQFRRSLAMGHGPIFISPLHSADKESAAPLRRRAVILSGGKVVEPRRIELLLNQPSWQRVRMIADRINERFGHENASLAFNTAVPVTDQIIRLNIPTRFAGRSEALIELIRHHYIQRGPNFEAAKARELATLLVTEPRYARDIVLVWQGLGRTIVPIIRRYYEHSNRRVQFAALDAGSRLNDETAAVHLVKVAQSPRASDRREAARILRNLPQSLRGSAALNRLVNDDDQSVRLAAYESLAAINDPNLTRVVFGDETQFKFVLDLVPSDKPLVYITHDRMPRLVLFDDNLAFKRPMLARFWDNRLIVRADQDEELATVFYQPRGRIEGKTYKIGRLVANLVFLLAHEPTISQPTQGLDLSYSDVVGAVYQLCKTGQVEAQIAVVDSPLEQAIARLERTQLAAGRPETTVAAHATGPDPATAAAAGGGDAPGTFVPLNVRDDEPADDAAPPSPNPWPDRGVIPAP